MAARPINQQGKCETLFIYFDIYSPIYAPMQISIFFAALWDFSPMKISNWQHIIGLAMIK
jgi:hypothetical protein